MSDEPFVLFVSFVVESIGFHILASEGDKEKRNIDRLLEII